MKYLIVNFNFGCGDFIKKCHYIQRKLYFSENLYLRRTSKNNITKTVSNVNKKSTLGLL